MLKHLQKTKDQKGFTIIEVLIVLAIAGLILLIVFLAVPALQRNSRNTARRNDVSRILGAIQEVADNNQGKIDTTVLTGTATGTVANAVGTLGYYQTANITVNAASTTATNTNPDNIAIYVGTTCNGNSLATGTSRQVAVLYAVEPSTQQCTSS
jgi:prepilin-type N-terminal cleavage/methylation domain-containing protein